jgi:hypothetical protein
VHSAFKVFITTAILFLLSIPISNLNAQAFPQEDQRRDEHGEWVKQQQREQAKARNLERQKKLKADTDRLLELATELKQYVDRSNENVLSVDVVKKCEEIEKLSKDIKNKMKGT